MQNSLRSTKLEINMTNFINNINEIKSLIGENTKLLLVLKADASGHGAVNLAKAAIKNGVDYFAVAFFDEAIQLKEKGIKEPILIFGVPNKDEMMKSIEYDFKLSVSSFEQAKILSELANNIDKVAKYHLIVDTGMNRIGINPDEILEFLNLDKCLDNISLEGVYTHYASTLSKNKRLMKNQYWQFKKVIAKIKDSSIDCPLFHAANSAATYEFKKSHFDMVRVSALSLNLPNTKDIKKDNNFKPILKFKTELSYKKAVPINSGISYDHIYKTDKNSTIGVLPVGYGDGYPSTLSNKGKVLIKGKFAPIVGKICMDQMMIDITEIPEAEVGDEVVLIGSQGDKELTPEWAANLAGFVHAELTSRISKRVSKQYIYN